MPEENGASEVFGVTPSESEPATDETVQSADVTPAQPQGEGEPIGEPTDVAPWEFKFRTSAGEKHFKSPEEATNFFSSWNGRIVQSDRERNEALSALDEWDRWFNSNKEKIESALQGKSTPTGGAVAPEPKEPDFVDGISWDYVNELLDAGKTAEAQKYVAWKTGELLKQQVNAVRDELKGEFERGLGPIQEQQAVREMSVQVMLAAQSARHPEHPETALFPEFQEGTPEYNPEFVSTFAQIWKQLDAQTALRPDLSGVELAYWRTKNLYSRRGSSAGDAAEQAVEAETNRFRQSTASRANAVGGGASPVKPVPGKKGTAMDRLFKGMESTARDEVFGTRRNK